MTPFLSIARPKPEFEAFLFAPIGEETNGMTLSVLSALSRMDVDPWDEAARLSRLPRDHAIAALEAIIIRMPRDHRPSQDNSSLAIRLAVLLPVPELGPPAGSTARRVRKDREFTIVLWLAAAFIVSCLVFGLPAQIEGLFVRDSVVVPVNAPPASR
jgi:hypothetical protein